MRWRGLCLALAAVVWSPRAAGLQSGRVPTVGRLGSRPWSGGVSPLGAGAGLGEPICEYHEVAVRTSLPGPPRQEVTVEDLTPVLRELLEASGLQQGWVNVISRHTTTAVTINEWESRLVADVRRWLLDLAPPDDRSAVGQHGKGVAYAHNDIDQRPDSEDERQRCLENGWDITDEAELERWRAQEPINAHSHLLSMLLGSSETIPVAGGAMVLGQWQSVMLVDLDGPRDRTVGIQVMGFR
uniref:Secondary thiamine-phosphate synthase enzyme n=1 Tax=Rhizochromulina marina TaxID=1034831 RepID=A0A7S2WUY0_9STRA|mmetsp:Transcript_7173/g.20748  ORF Transcript_7173/g.20748 Transcript_7173/m.20748 type:complete len:241 (+) Transcript_7173:23-745(+)